MQLKIVINIYLGNNGQQQTELGVYTGHFKKSALHLVGIIFCAAVTKE